jgi:peptidoglycan/xylan/chitin deacetylase (PgdA/CDA1 family)
MSFTSLIIKKLGPYGIYSLTKELTRKYPRVLMYHRFSSTIKYRFTSKAYFEKQIAYISRQYNPLTLSQLIDLKYFHNEKMPDNSIVITVDDGYLDFYDVAFPILKKYNVPATLYVTSGFIDGRLWLWPDKISWILDQTQEIPEQVQVGELLVQSGVIDHSNRIKLWQEIIDYMLNIPNEKRDDLIQELGRKLDITLPNLPPQEYKGLNWQQLQEIQSEGIEIGGHTLSHPSLIQLDQNKAWEEIWGSMDELQKNLGSSPKTFCYPNGSPTDINQELKSLVHQAGYIGAVVAFADTANIRDRYAIRRHACSDSMFQFHKAVSGTELLGKKLRKTFKQDM